MATSKVQRTIPANVTATRRAIAFPIFDSLALSVPRFLILAGFALLSSPVHAVDSRGNQFVGFDEFSSFNKSADDETNQIVLISPEIAAQIKWTELIISWNTKMSESSNLKVEARGIYPDRATKYYTMALWSSVPGGQLRESATHQKDADGNVSTDTLILNKPCDRFQLRVTLRGA